MPDYSQEKAMRIATFERWIDVMLQHRSDEGKRDCGITFEENPPEDCDTPQLQVSRALALPPVLAGEQAGGGGGRDLLDQNIVEVPIDDSGGGGGGTGDGSERFLQFAFKTRTFYMDLPNNTLWPDEARRLFARRSGFFYLGDRRWPWMSVVSWKNTVKKWNPVQKEYLNSDARGAAEDMAFILFTLWRFPLDWQFWYHALVFRGRKKRDWEGRGPVR